MLLSVIGIALVIFIFPPISLKTILITIFHLPKVLKKKRYDIGLKFV